MYFTLAGVLLCSTALATWSAHPPYQRSYSTTSLSSSLDNQRAELGEAGAPGERHTFLAADRSVGCGKWWKKKSCFDFQNLINDLQVFGCFQECNRSLCALQPHPEVELRVPSARKNTAGPAQTGDDCHRHTTSRQGHSVSVNKVRYYKDNT